MLYFSRLGKVLWEAEMLAIKHFILSIHCLYMEKQWCSVTLLSDRDAWDLKTATSCLIISYYVMSNFHNEDKIQVPIRNL